MRKALVLLAAIVVCPPGVAVAQTVVRHLEVESDLAAKQEAALLERYEAARSQEKSARGRVEEAAAALDERLVQGSATIEELEALKRRLGQAGAQEEAARGEARDLLSRLLELRRRQEILAAELRRTRGAPAGLPDPITGAWNVTLHPGDRRGLLDLTLDGTAISGTLGLEDGSFGSVRGSLTSGSVRLERVGAQGGLDLVLEGRLDRADGTVEGTWRSVVLGRGEPEGGTWTAEKTREDGDTASGGDG